MSDHEHTFANPGPAALTALAMACFAFFAIYTGKVGATAAPVLACWMIGGGLIQYAVAWMELKNGDIKGGNVFLMFGSFFMFVTALSLFTKYMLSQHGMQFDAHIEGWCWLAATLALIVWTPAYMKNSPKIMFLVVGLVDIALLLISFMDMGVLAGATYKPIAGWILFVVGVLGVYVSGAIMLNTVFGKSILPTTTPMIK